MKLGFNYFKLHCENFNSLHSLQVARHISKTKTNL